MNLKLLWFTLKFTRAFCLWNLTGWNRLISVDNSSCLHHEQKQKFDVYQLNHLHHWSVLAEKRSSSYSAFCVALIKKMWRPISLLQCVSGVLLRKLEAGIRGISHVIVDEIHERDINVSRLIAWVMDVESGIHWNSLLVELQCFRLKCPVFSCVVWPFYVSVQTDFLMVVLRDVVQAYPEVRVILMSATIDTTMFREYFFNCPIIEVFGRTFPVQGTSDWPDWPLSV